MTLNSINAADPNNPTVDPVPYVGIQFVAIPEFAGHRHAGRPGILGRLAGQQTAEEALAKAQALDDRRDGSRRLLSHPPGRGAASRRPPAPASGKQRTTPIGRDRARLRPATEER